MKTILTNHFSTHELAEIFRLSIKDAYALTVDPAARLTLGQFAKLNPIFRKIPKRPKLPIKYPSYEDMSTLRVVVKSRIAPRVVFLQYKRRHATFENMQKVDSTDAILRELIESTDVVNDDIHRTVQRRSPFFDRRSNDQFKDDLRKMRKLFKDDLPKIRKVIMDDKRKFKTIYGFDPYVVEDEENPILPDRLLLDTIRPSQDDYILTPFPGSDLEFVRYLKTVDYFYVPFETPTTTLLYSHSGSLLGATTKDSLYIANYKGTSPLERPLVIAASKTGEFFFPVFTDTFVTAVEHNNNTLIITSESTSISKTKPDVILEQSKNPSYNLKSQALKTNPTTRFIVNGRLSIPRVI